MFLKSKRFLSLFLCAVLTLAAFSPVFGEISSESTGTKFFSDIDTEKVIAFLQQPAGDTGYCNGEILRITEGSIAPVACLDQDPNECERAGECMTLPVWQGLYEVITNYLDNITLQDILDMQKDRASDSYMI